MTPVENPPVLEPLSFKFASSFIVLTILAGLGVGVARVLTSLYAVHIQATALQLGLIAAAQSIGLLFMALPVGVMVQRFGSLRIFSLGSLIGAALYSLQSLSASAWYLLALTALVSFVLPMRFVSIHTVFLSNLRRLGPAKAGWFRGSHMMGFFLIAPALTVLLIEHAGYHGAFYAVTALFLTAMVFAPVCFSRQPRPAAALQKLTWAEIAEPLKLIKTHPHLRTVCSLEFMSNIANNYFGFFIVVIAIQNFQLQESLAVMLLTVQGIVFVGSLFSLGALAEIAGYHKFYVISLSLISFALISLSFAQQVLWLWPASVALGLGLGMLHIANFMSFAKVGEQTSMSKISPLLAMVGPAGGLLGGIAGAMFGQQLGLQNLFAPIGITFVCLTFFVFRNLSFQQFLQQEPSTQLQRQEP
ncbi:MFS transporter [Acinetobacter pragensis]|uniref:MFS transporter n=1 Tax=Acinetobacter pragensis TaxID=1806892 RepID=UPI0033410C30